MASTSEQAGTETVNTLGLELEQLSVSQPEDDSVAKDDATSPPPSASTAESKEKRTKEKPYHNPDRVLTGGSQREKLSDAELAERMSRIRDQNEKIKQRRIDVDADERAFRESQEAEKQRQAKSRKVQDSINRAREQNAQRKMDKVQGREWDTGKKSAESWVKNQQPKAPAPAGDIKLSSASPNSSSSAAAAADTPTSAPDTAPEPTAADTVADASSAPAAPAADSTASPTSPGREPMGPRGRGGRGGRGGPRGGGDGRGRGRGRGRGGGPGKESGQEAKSPPPHLPDSTS